MIDERDPRPDPTAGFSIRVLCQWEIGSSQVFLMSKDGTWRIHAERGADRRALGHVGVVHRITPFRTRATAREAATSILGISGTYRRDSLYRIGGTEVEARRRDGWWHLYDRVEYVDVSIDGIERWRTRRAALEALASTGDRYALGAVPGGHEA